MGLKSNKRIFNGKTYTYYIYKMNLHDAKRTAREIQNQYYTRIIKHGYGGATIYIRKR